jgi:hypothetical protein
MCRSQDGLLQYCLAAKKEGRFTSPGSLFNLQYTCSWGNPCCPKTNYTDVSWYYSNSGNYNGLPDPYRTITPSSGQCPAAGTGTSAEGKCQFSSKCEVCGLQPD